MKIPAILTCSVLGLALAQPAMAQLGNNSEPWRAGFGYDIVKDLKYILSSSTVPAQDAAWIDPAMAKWNGVTSRVNVSKATSGTYQLVVTYDNTPPNSPAPAPKPYGQMVPFCPPTPNTSIVLTNGVVTTDLSNLNCIGPTTPQMFQTAQLKLYPTNFVGLAFPGIPTYNQDVRKFTISHELGHVLSMAHNSQSNTNGLRNLMSEDGEQAVLSSHSILGFGTAAGSAGANELRQPDKDALIKRWGL